MWITSGDNLCVSSEYLVEKNNFDNLINKSRLIFEKNPFFAKIWDEKEKMWIGSHLSTFWAITTREIERKNDIVKNHHP